MSKVPHVIPYQGSKRKLAEQILAFVDFEINTLYEPFAGSAAITLAAAAKKMANRYVINDKLSSLSELWRLVINEPNLIADQYREIWSAHAGDSYGHYFKIREIYNQKKAPAALLYLAARCVKNAIRFNANGDFNQSPDKRRLGVSPDKFERSALAVSRLLKGKTQVLSTDFRDAVLSATDKDCVYLDPPWQGTSSNRDQRYAHVLNLQDLIDGLDELNQKKVPFVLSFDGTLGEKRYGEELPKFLDLTRVALNAGRSSQATLLGRDDVTIESLYLSASLMEKTSSAKSSKTQEVQLAMFS
jgi:DNA adenine methylase